ncbi:hypothetical protein [Kitasatospora sp. CB02891]|uniref:hypothetical protein n=1 Tax=Kitasatospora sp. CB02891 TaxID=2020329 RepID=UPI000C26F5B1|nr:hypothetical protein [Kitasatospora sp. CB02891]PJN24030.1 hypothetical protein CG736_19220 [Kitasatospora sp. CB02891]
MKPTELGLQSRTFTVLAGLTARADAAGVPGPAPQWRVTDDMVTGWIDTADGTAFTALDGWFRRVLGAGRFETRTEQRPDGPRCIWAIGTVIEDVSVHLAASVPAGAAQRQQAVAA